MVEFLPTLIFALRLQQFFKLLFYLIEFHRIGHEVLLPSKGVNEIFFAG